MVTVSVDGSVLDRITKIMSYLRLGSSGKVLKKKKKEKDGKGACIYTIFFWNLKLNILIGGKKAFVELFCLFWF